MSQFQEESQQICSGCYPQFQENQLAHMEEGGCLSEIPTPAKCLFRGLDKNQDYGLIETFKNYTCMLGFDGHGHDSFINLLRQSNLTSCMAQPDTLTALLEMLEPNRMQGFNSGATYIEAKIFADHVETCVVGDSQIVVFIDDELVYMNTPHNLKNESEQIRLAERIKTNRVKVTQNGAIPESYGKDTMKARHSEYIIFENGESLALSQSLGHLNVTGICPEKHTIHFTPDQKVRVLMGSDGLWEMMNIRDDIKQHKPDDYAEDAKLLASSTCLEIMDIAEARWKQPWKYYYSLTNPAVHMTTTFTNTDSRSSRSGYDDVLVMIHDVCGMK